MKNRIWMVAILLAVSFGVIYQVYFTDRPVTMDTWYEGQDITEGSDPMPFDASGQTAARYPERDELGNLPSDVYRLYIDAASRERFELALLTDLSRAQFASRQPSRQQLRNSVVSYRECSGAEELALYDLAVVRYPPHLRRCEPLLFRREQGLWRVDFHAMGESIGFNQDNQWHFRQGGSPAEYAFAFAGWRFDDNGYPLIP
jgi:hypothetical protein